jgi:hypothetical protein
VGLQAEELAAKAGQLEMARTFRHRVDAFYRGGHPFREGPAAAGVPSTGELREARITEP